MTKKIDLSKDEWILIQGCLEEKLTKLGALEWPLNQMTSGAFIEIHQKIANLLSDTNKPKNNS